MTQHSVSVQSTNARQEMDKAVNAAERRILVVDDDPLFRESITQNLEDAGFAVEDFADGRSFLEDFSADTRASLLLLDWKMPEMNGIEVLREVRRIRSDLPVIFLTVLSDQIYEEAALLGGAVDFVEKSRSFAIISKRIEIILKLHAEQQAVDTEQEEEGELELDKLRLDLTSHRAFWSGEELGLTLTEFGMVKQLAGRAGKDVTYRDLYDVVHGRGFHAGQGSDGYRANVRAAIKRIRQKFKEVDGDFDQIENYPGFGYRWRVR